MESYGKLAKQELLDVLMEKDAQLRSYEEMKAKYEAILVQNKDFLTTRDNAINAEFTIRKEIEKNAKAVADLTAERDYLKGELNELSDLFNEYVISRKDQTAMMNVFVNNDKTVQQLMDSKIARFNMRNNPSNKENKK